MKSITKKIVLSALLAALVCVATMIIKIPSPLQGYINLGDCMVLLCGWLLPPGYGFLAAGLGSALADLLSPYALYAPATFVIKGLMAIIAYAGYAVFSQKVKSFPSRLLSGLLAELLMILGYFLFEGILYGFGAALVNIPANGVQGLAGLAIGTLLIKLFEKQRFTTYFNLTR